MKNILLGLNVVLAACVAYLMYKQVGENKAASSTVTTKDSTGKTTNLPSPVKIAYFEMDSIESNMDLLKDIRIQLSKSSNDAEGTLINMKKNLQSRAQQLQQKAQAQQMNQQEQEAAQNELRKMQNDIALKEQSLTQELQKESMEKMQKAHKMIEDFLADYNKTKGYNFIFASSKGFFYLKDSAYDITKAVLEGINKNYQKK